MAFKFVKMIFLFVVSSLFLEGSMPLDVEEGDVPEILYVVRKKNIEIIGGKPFLKSQKFTSLREEGEYKSHEIVAYKTKLAALLATYMSNCTLGTQEKGLRIEFDCGDYKSLDEAVNKAFPNKLVQILTISSFAYQSAHGHRAGVDHFYRDFGPDEKIQEIVDCETINLNEYVNQEIIAGRLQVYLWGRERKEEMDKQLRKLEKREEFNLLFWRWLF